MKGGSASVHCDDSKWTKQRQILQQTGAQDIASAGEAAADTAE
jgi:hypothetical protein